MHNQVAVLADGANLTGDGKLNILGVFDRINTPTVPFVHALMYFVVKLQLSNADGSEVGLRFRIVDAEGNLISREVTIRARVVLESHGEALHLPLLIPIAAALFRDFGTYSFELWQDGGTRLAEVPLTIALAKSP